MQAWRATIAIAIRTTIALPVLALAAGCASPTPEDLEYAQRQRAQLTVMLEQFCKVVVDKNPAEADPLLSPRLGPLEKMRLRQQIKQAVWLKQYTGYTFDMPGSLQGASWRRLRDGELYLKVRAGNSSGEHFKDRYWLQRVGQNDWRIARLRLQEVEPGALADPPEAEAAAIRAVLSEIVALLKAGKGEHVFYMRPSGRGPMPGVPEEPLDSIVRREYVELRAIKDLTILQWPDVASEVRLIYGGPGVIVAPLELLYMWPQMNMVTPRGLTITISLLRQEDKWAPYAFKVEYAKK
jgi:hypothetical protein